MSVVEGHEEPGLRFYPPEEAWKRACPLPPHDEFVLRGIPDDEWEAFQAAIADT